MGMPFLLGISLVHKTSSELIPWAWGISGYATVIGSPLCLILAITVGFKVRAPAGKLDIHSRSDNDFQAQGYIKRIAAGQETDIFQISQ